jgi:hypothetical protein
MNTSTNTNELDYKMYKANMAWEMVKRVIPEGVHVGGGENRKWDEDNYLSTVKKLLKEASSAVNAAFH